MGAILSEAGPEKFRAWVQALKDHGLRLYDGNSAVVRAVANGEVDIGLADSDDAFAGEHEQWPVSHAFPGFLPGQGPLALPNTVGEVKGAPHPAEAAKLIEFLLSERVERILAASDSREAPARPGLAGQTGVELPVEPVDFEAIAARIPEALKIWDEVFGG
jgi:iron(III) transport system substrate-binding protein